MDLALQGGGAHGAFTWGVLDRLLEAVLMHGHRHIDWIGRCAGLVVVSAPSPVMEATDEQTTGFYIHTLAIGTDGKLKLLAPERIGVRGEHSNDA